jgi:hypothetical protein
MEEPSIDSTTISSTKESINEKSSIANNDNHMGDSDGEMSEQ